MGLLDRIFGEKKRVSPEPLSGPCPVPWIHSAVWETRLDPGRYPAQLYGSDPAVQENGEPAFSEADGTPVEPSPAIWSHFSGAGISVGPELPQTPRVTAEWNPIQWPISVGHPCVLIAVNPSPLELAEWERMLGPLDQVPGFGVGLPVDFGEILSRARGQWDPQVSMHLWCCSHTKQVFAGVSFT